MEGTLQVARYSHSYRQCVGRLCCHVLYDEMSYQHNVDQSFIKWRCEVPKPVNSLPISQCL